MSAADRVEAFLDEADHYGAIADSNGVVCQIFEGDDALTLTADDLRELVQKARVVDGTLKGLERGLTLGDLEIDKSTETGQPNGIGQTEPSWYREWYHDGRVTHDRSVITIYGPWVAR
jgi:hypothetical protein